MADGAGKKALIERLFSEHRTALQAFFRRRIRVAPDAPDLAQEVYVRMLGVQHTESIRNPELYLYTVANNLLKERAAAERHRAACDDIDDAAVQAQLAELPRLEGEVDLELRAQRLREVLHQLPPKCRAAVVLQYDHDLSYEDIGARLGISVHMVKKYLTKALGHCRRRMQRLS
jgi:RNA polymerase sigma-70 factor (ECF subfamily)